MVSCTYNTVVNLRLGTSSARKRSLAGSPLRDFCNVQMGGERAVRRKIMLVSGAQLAPVNDNRLIIFKTPTS